MPKIKRKCTLKCPCLNYYSPKCDVRSVITTKYESILLKRDLASAVLLVLHRIVFVMQRHPQICHESAEQSHPA
jgi:hypothetical protein